jgi:hypothetical protein
MDHLLCFLFWRLPAKYGGTQRSRDSHDFEEFRSDIARPKWSSFPQCATMLSGEQCDEFPFFSTEEGYPTAILNLLPIPGNTDNAVQGGYLSNFYSRCPVLQNSDRNAPGRQYLVIPLPFLPTATRCPST